MDNYNWLAILIDTVWEHGGRRTTGTANGIDTRGWGYQS